MHARFLELRNRVFGHRDATAHGIRVWIKEGVHGSDISGKLPIIFASHDLKMVEEMTFKLSLAIQEKEKQLRKSILKAGIPLESI